MTTYANGVMTVTIDGAEIELLANVRAVRTICRLYKGLTQAFQSVTEFDFDVIVNILNAAANRTGKEAEATAEAVFAEGLVSVQPLAIAYLGFLSSGGKAPKTGADTDEGKDKDGSTGES